VLVQTALLTRRQLNVSSLMNSRRKCNAIFISIFPQCGFEGFVSFERVGFDAFRWVTSSFACVFCVRLIEIGESHIFGRYLTYSKSPEIKRISQTKQFDREENGSGRKKESFSSFLFFLKVTVLQTKSSNYYLVRPSK